MTELQKFLKTANTPWKMRFFMFKRLPGAWFMGVQVRKVSGTTCETGLDYGWKSQNPFRSVYFAAQMAAAEMSTGLLAMAALQDQPPVSMLVIKSEGNFFKKADKSLRFVCNQGELVAQAIQEAVKTGESRTIDLISIALLPDGTEAARFSFTWSFKKK